MSKERENIEQTVDIKMSLRDLERTVSALVTELQGLSEDAYRHPGFVEAALKTEFLGKLQRNVTHLQSVEKDLLTLHEQVHVALRDWQPPAADEDERPPRR